MSMAGPSRRALDAMGKLWRLHNQALPLGARELLFHAIEAAKCGSVSIAGPGGDLAPHKNSLDEAGSKVPGDSGIHLQGSCSDSVLDPGPSSPRGELCSAARGVDTPAVAVDCAEEGRDWPDLACLPFTHKRVNGHIFSHRANRKLLHTLLDA